MFEGSLSRSAGTAKLALFYQRRDRPPPWRRARHTRDVYPRRARMSGAARPTMTRLSGYLLPTEKQTPAAAEAPPDKLKVGGGLIRQMGAGMWSWLPAGWRVHQRAVRIIREEMDAIGAQEMLMPVLQPAEPWRK